MVEIRQIQATDVFAVKILADANRATLGFNTRKKFEEAAQQRRAFVAVVDGEVAGFVVFRHRRADLQTTLSEICVQQAYRNQHIGESLIRELVKECSQMSREFIQLKCPVNLTANQFYQRLGFALYGTEAGKKRSLNVWRFFLPPNRTNET